MYRSEYPRPQFVRPDWLNLNGEWSYTFDFGQSGLERGLQNSTGFEGRIQIPFCPESKLSGVAHTDFIPALFYHRTITIPADWNGKRILLHFGAVDYDCRAFVDGKLAGRHIGGSSSFFFDITALVTAGSTHHLVVYAEDNLRLLTQGGGKQSTHFKSAGCHYTRVTGIWQTVWLEAVAMSGIRSCRVTPNLDDGAFTFTPTFFQTERGLRFHVTVRMGETVVGQATAAANDAVPLTVPLRDIRPWSPEDPFLYDIDYAVEAADGTLLDHATGYAGLRKIHIEGNKYFLNNKEVFLRFVLDQGFYPDGIWTAPSDEALKQDILLSMAAGFNGARLHQKVFEERFHYWADKLGYLTWGEYPSWGMAWTRPGAAETEGNLELSAAAQEASFGNFLMEWPAVMERDFSHPSIISWSPVNETSTILNWEAYRLRMAAVYDLTRRTDPTRPVNETSGYLHVKTDLWTVHVYRQNAEELRKSLVPEDGYPVFRHDPAHEAPYGGQPYFNDEFGGFMFIPPERCKFADNTWGYYGMSLKNEDELCAKIAEQVDTMLTIPQLCGYCYTQLTDVEQEQNGVYNYDRTPKVSDGKLKAIFGKPRP